MNAEPATKIILLGILLIVSLACFFLINSLAVIYRRRFLRLFFISSVLIFLVLSALLLNYFSYSFSDTLAIVGLLITFLLGSEGSNFLKRRYEPLAVLAIPSKSIFHEELRKGFYGNISNIPIKLEDLFAGQKSNEMFEDLAGYIPLVQKAEVLKPDYLITWPPSQNQTNSEELAEIFSRLIKRGGRIMVMQNPPQNIESFRGMLTCIYSEVTEGARILAAYAVSILHEGNTVLFLNGPGYSPPAQARKKILISFLEESHLNLINQDLPGWSEEGAYIRMRSFLQEKKEIDLVICGNDTMAMGAVRAIKEFNKTKRRVRTASIKVFGYDGLTRALISIADKDSPFYATIRIPPSSYGRTAANIIRAEINGTSRPQLSDFMKKISIDGTNLVTKENADKLLEYL